MGISENYLSRIFAKETGEKLQDYIVRVRVEKAENLLRYSDVSIAEIAAYVNFPSQSYFGRVFRKYTGDTPGNYRNKWKPTEFT
jgi:AraC-like DNA-binding protein